MKQKKYSESKIITAQKFLSKYELSFDGLNESQKGIVIGYTQAKKHLLLCVILLTLGIIVCSISAYISYESVKYFIGVNCDLSTIKDNDALRSFGKACFGLGFGSCLYSCVACLMLIYIIVISITLKTKRQILDAFLPVIEQPSDNDQIPNQ